MARIDEKTTATSWPTNGRFVFIDPDQSNNSEKLRQIDPQYFLASYNKLVEPVHISHCTESLAVIADRTYYLRQYIMQGQKLRYCRVFCNSHSSDQTVHASIYIGTDQEQTGSVSITAADTWFTIDTGADYIASTNEEVVLALTLQGTATVGFPSFTTQSDTDHVSYQASTSTPPSSIGTEVATTACFHMQWF